MNKIKDYIKNIDFELVDDDVMLDNVYNEIKGHEEKCIIDLEVSYNMEQLIKKSNINQLIRMLRNVNVIQVINKKIGSRVFEVVFETLFVLVYKKNVNDKEIEEIKLVLLDPIYQNFIEILNNRNGTFVLRKYFELIYGRKVNKVDKKHKILLVNDYDFKTKISSYLKGYIQVENFITVMTYLKLNYSKKIARKIVEIHLTLENIKSPHYSFIFEDLVEIGDKKTLDNISKFVENNFLELMNDKYGNYVLTKVIKKRPEDTEFFYSKLDLSTLNMNSNIVLRIFENFCKNGDIEKIKKILREFYHVDKGESVFQSLLLKFSDGINTKYVTAICHLMDLDEDVFNVNIDFVKFYDNSWLNKKCGITLVKGFLEGGAKNKTKRKLLPKITLNKKLLKTKDGSKISNLIKTIKNTRK